MAKSSTPAGNPSGAANPDSPEPLADDIPKGGGSIVGLRASKWSNAQAQPPGKSPEIKPRTVLSAVAAPAKDTTAQGLRPKPLPKPRPVSLLNLDQVKDSKEAAKPQVTAGGNRVGAVRDMFNNMNRGGANSSGSAESSPVSAGASTTTTAAGAGVEFRRKGNSLPRGTAPGAVSGARMPSGGSSDSPIMTKKDSATDDDPRILKLDDEFDVEDV